jgi:hypothetical protein
LSAAKSINKRFREGAIHNAETVTITQAAESAEVNR